MGSLGAEIFDQVSAEVVNKLRKSLKASTVYTPGDEGYAASIVRWSDAFEKKAAIVVYVRSPEDVATTLKYCQDNKINFVVSGGKHSVGGTSSIEGGLVIDLAKMRDVTVNEADKTVDVGGGCVWKDVDEAAGKYDLAAVGGTINHTGVGGLTCGGGYGWLTGRYGLTIDNLVRAEVVLANGSIVEASDNNNQDLFWAIRGAGQCFGVITKFTFQCHEQKDPIWSGQMVFKADEHLDAVVNFANSLMAGKNPDAAMLMGITAPPFVRGPAIVVTAFYNGPKNAGEAIFEPLLRLGPIKNTCDERPYDTMNGIMNHAVEYGGRKISKGASFVLPLRPTFVRELVEELTFLHDEVPVTKRSILLFEFYNNVEVVKVPTSAMSFANRGWHQNALMGPNWSDPKDDEKCKRWLAHMSTQFRNELDRIGIENGNLAEMQTIGEYGNYDGTGVAPQEMFGPNYARLTELKAKFDPENMFNSSYDLTLPA
ncbi:hypothetical protein G7Y89_g4157 [Cudoniella acicularis]|uniref:FAD-binding PCMH-type domain-containing protein n=1 Tax=Cudoniella acicularis TaxID=354080 RepID=A0A8H4W7Q6_9HELO|nr:hypothetical protein G7Y89_g4157 [Cudoniella acicularis]